MNKVNLDLIDFSTYSLENLLKLSTEIDQFISNSNFPIANNFDNVAEEIAYLYRNINTTLYAKNIISKINKAIVEKNNQLDVKANSEEILEKLMNENESGRIIVKQTTSGFKFDIVSYKNEVLASSEIYSTLNGCLNGISSVKHNAVDGTIYDQTIKNTSVKPNPKFVIYLDKVGEYRFRLKARNGEILAASDAYKSKESCINDINKLKNIITRAEIVRL